MDEKDWLIIKTLYEKKKHLQSSRAPLHLSTGFNVPHTKY